MSSATVAVGRADLRPKPPRGARTMHTADDLGPITSRAVLTDKSSKQEEAGMPLLPHASSALRERKQMIGVETDKYVTKRDVNVMVSFGNFDRLWKGWDHLPIQESSVFGGSVSSSSAA